MKIDLAENVRRFRKERRLTQEQLAEVLGVTAGAVYKWESGLSVPDISLIVEMADFFDTSVDVLLGYRVKDNRIQSVMQRFDEMCRTRDKEALTEAEKVLKKYPHSFDAVHGCAAVYSFFGVGEGNEAYSRRAMELYEQSRLLIGQNTDPKISDETILAEIALIHVLLKEPERALEIIKAHNPDGVFCDSVGLILTLLLNRPDEAEPYLLEGMLRSMSALLNSLLGYASVLSARGEFDAAQKLLEIGLDLLNKLHGEDVSDFSDKMYAMLYIGIAYARLKKGERDAALALLRKSAEYVRRFDEAPDFSLKTFVVEISDLTLLHDSLGDSARESAETLIGYLKDPELGKLWREAQEKK